jgi:hypothetical protein
MEISPVTSLSPVRGPAVPTLQGDFLADPPIRFVPGIRDRDRARDFLDLGLRELP